MAFHTGIAETLNTHYFYIFFKIYLNPAYRATLGSSDLLLAAVSAHCLSALSHGPWLQHKNRFIFLGLNLMAEMWLLCFGCLFGVFLIKNNLFLGKP